MHTVLFWLNFVLMLMNGMTHLKVYLHIAVCFCQSACYTGISLKWEILLSFCP